MVALVGCLLAGCGPEAQSPAPQPRAEVRGEPIRGEPIVPPANTTSAANVPAPTTAPAVEAVSKEASVAGGTGSPNTPASTVTAVVSPVVKVRGEASESNAAPAVAKAVVPGVGTSASPLSIGFDKLASFSYALPEGPVDTNTVVQTAAATQIPDTIRSLNNQFISLKGFMLPLKVEKGLVTELLIMRDQSMCCYGTVPKINEWVSVKMVGDGVKPIMDQAVTLFGKLKVGEMYENGYLVGIYALDGEKMAGPLDL